MSNPEEHILEVLKDLPVQMKRNHRIFLPVPREDLIKTMNILSSTLAIQHLSTITARDMGNDLEILYHFLYHGVVITIKTTCPKTDPSVESIVPVFPSAILYEREIHDILGIVPTGHPDLRRLVLPDEWVGGYPLRKDWKQPAEQEAEE
jgi:NADH:ubiquinone oxidoreductase subunit C